MQLPRLLPRRSTPANRFGVLARMRVGTKLMVLVLLPLCSLLGLAWVAATDHWREADQLREFRSATRLSFASASAVDALANERLATALGRLGVRSGDRPQLAATRRAVDAALQRAAGRPSGEHVPVDVAGRLRPVRRQLDALRRRVGTGSIGVQELVEDYGVIARGLFGIVRDLDSGRPSRGSGRAADAYVALVQGIEGAEMERVTLAAALVRGTEAVRVRGVVLEAAELDTFRQYAARGLVADLGTLLSEPASATVDRARQLMIRDPASIQRQLTVRDWLAASGARIGALHRLKRESAQELAAASSKDLDAADATARRAVIASLCVLIVVAGLGLILRRSITRPLGEVSRGARMLSSGQPASGVSYAGRDEIGEVAAAFRELQATTERLAQEIRAMTVAVEHNRLDHRADVSTFEGRWAELMGGVNDTIAAFGELQARRVEAERQADRIIDMSLDPICIAGFDGYFKRVNPAFARLLGYPTETMLSRPTRDFVHPSDRASRDARHARRDSGEDVRYEQRQLCSDGSVRRVEWSARFVPDQRLVYGVGRDVTESRRAADEQAALRRVATLVAKGVAPAEIFAAVAREVRALFESDSATVVRSEPDGSIAVLGAAPDGSGASHEDVAAAVLGAGRAISTGGAVGAPIVVEDRLWGAIAASEGGEPLPPGAEQRLARFTDLVATAIANAESRAEVAASRARVVAAADQERRWVVRDLHDGAQQGLVHTIITLELACSAHEAGDEQAWAFVAEAIEHARRANEELRELSHGILPAPLASGGLRKGVSTLVSRVPLKVATHVSVDRLPSVVEATAYFVVAEALTNVVKHARANHADVKVDLEDGTLRIAVRDDGVGGARPDGSGLVGLRDRLEALDGRLGIDSPLGRGTLVTAEIRLSGQAVAQAASTGESATSARA